MLLYVGLGNPGPRYAETPHNAGFVVCDRFAAKHGFGAMGAKFKGEFVRGRALGADVGLLKPRTFMNLSGESVAEALRYLPVEPANIVVVFDEMDIPSGKLRLRLKGGHGGHNGLRSIIECIGSSDFPRIRVGIGRPPEGREPTGHLLSKVASSERERFSATVDLAVEALEVVIGQGFEAAMNRFNALERIGGAEPDTEE
jgi:PTH1 family peptidyl-tRNA hydrolase